VVAVDLANGRDEPVVERADDRAGRVGRLVEQVVSADRRLVAVARREGLPQVHDAILEVRVLPEGGDVGRVVGVPVLVLAAGHGVQVDDAVDAVLGAQSHDRVEALEARLEQLERTVIALEVAVVHRDPHAVDAEAGEETRVAVLEEARQHAVEEASSAQRSEHRGHGGPHLALRGRIAGDEVLHVHPAAEAHAPQHDARALGIDDPVAVDAQQAWDRKFRTVLLLVFGLGTLGEPNLPRQDSRLTRDVRVRQSSKLHRNLW
jgi:hypothetical protein